MSTDYEQSLARLRELLSPCAVCRGVGSYGEPPVRCFACSTSLLQPDERLALTTSWRDATTPGIVRALIAERDELLAVAQKFIDTIHHVENRCMAADGPVTLTCQEITDSELRAVYDAASAAIADAAMKP